VLRAITRWSATPLCFLTKSPTSLTIQCGAFFLCSLCSARSSGQVGVVSFPTHKLIFTAHSILIVNSQPSQKRHCLVFLLAFVLAWLEPF
jgi:hypothetical protein